MSNNITLSERWHLWVMLNIGYITYGDEVTLVNKETGTKKTFIVHSKKDYSIEIVKKKRQSIDIPLLS